MMGETRTATLLQLRENNVPRGVATVHPLIAARAEGARIWDVDGKAYLDFVGGIGVLNVGHRHPRVVQAVQAQLERLTHTCFHVTLYEPYLQLAARLNQLVEAGRPMKTIFLTTGAEATENAIKIVRAATGRPGVIAFTGGFHGRTLLGMSLTGLSRPYKQSFGPFAPEVYHAPYPYTYRGWTTERALAGLHELFETQIAPERVAAMIIEPQLGDGGFVPAPAAFLQALRRITSEHGIVLIADEIQTGFGRTGKLFGYQHAEIQPDLITVAKSLAGGLPLSGVIGRAELMDAPEPGGLGGTYAGNPLACAAGLAVLDVFAEEGLIERGAALGARLREGFEALQQRFPQIGDIRGLGPMLALELVKDPVSKEPDPELTNRVITAARERGLLIIRCGIYRNVLRVPVPLVASNADMEASLTILEDAFAAACAV